jgi:NAD(P)-dependent dehydrogenase (short-subunit alcohol dehydrogenase family)
MRVIVTGAASGIGRAAAIRLARDAVNRGKTAQILLVDIAKEKLDETAALVRAEKAHAEAYAADLSDATVAAGIVDAARRTYGGLDALISNAGVIQRSSLLDLSVATASISGHEPTPPLGAYSASKAALIMLVRQMAVEWGPDGIRCNTVSPGSTHTAMTDARYSDPVQREAAAQRSPLRMVGLPENQAAAIAFLVGPDAAFITGVDLLVDGGLSTMLMPASGFGDPWRK